jgi:hypothetical protein
MAQATTYYTAEKYNDKTTYWNLVKGWECHAIGTLTKKLDARVARSGNRDDYRIVKMTKEIISC